MYSPPLFAQVQNQPYSNEILYRQFIHKTFPIKTSKDLTLTYVALSAIFHKRAIPKCALEGALGKRVQFFQKTYSAGSEAFKKTLRKQIEKEKKEIEDLSPENKKSYLANHTAISPANFLFELTLDKVNQRNLSFILAQILPLQNPLSLSQKLQYSLAIESLTTETMNPVNLLDIIHSLQNLDLTNPNSELCLEDKSLVITQLKWLTKNTTDCIKIKIIRFFSHLNLQSRLQLFEWVQSFSTQSTLEISKANTVNSLVFIYSKTLKTPFHERLSLAEQILSLIPPDLKESHISNMMSELTFIPSNQRSSVLRLVQSLDFSEMTDLTGVIMIPYLLSINTPTNSDLFETSARFMSYSPQKRSILVNLIQDLLKLTDHAEISSVLFSDPEILDHYNPTYITNRDPLTFNHQEDYLRRSREVISIGAKIINSVHIANKKPLFFLLLHYFSKERGLIAKDHKTENASKFGVRRDFNTPREAIIACTTPLYSQYQECGRKLLDFLKPHVSKLLSIKLSSSKTVSELKAQTLRCQSILQIELLDKKKVEEILSPKTSCLNSHSLDKKNHNITTSLSKIGNLPSKSSEAFLVEVFVSIEIKKRHLLTQYYTLVSRDSLNPNAIHFSDIIALHQDHSLIQETLDEAAQIFEELMDLDGKDLSCFQEKLALLTYILAHNVRDCQGSAAETEWLIHAICLAKNLTISEDPNRLQDLEAFSNPLLSDYIEVHKDMIKLSRN